MDIGSVPGEIGILPEYREVTGTPKEVNGPQWAFTEKRRVGQGRDARPVPLYSELDKEGGAARPFPSSPPPLSPPLLIQLGKGRESELDLES